MVQKKLTLEKIINFFYNSHLANEMKDVFYFIFGCPCDEYMYFPRTDSYLSFISRRRSLSVLGKKELVVKRVPADISPKHRLLTSGWTLFVRLRVIGDMRRFFPEEEFRFRRFLTMKTTDSEKTSRGGINSDIFDH